MEVKTLYRFKRDDGGITDSPNKPKGEYIERFRLIASSGMSITTDGKNLYPVIDVDNVEGYYEVPNIENIDHGA